MNDNAPILVIVPPRTTLVHPPLPKRVMTETTLSKKCVLLMVKLTVPFCVDLLLTH